MFIVSKSEYLYSQLFSLHKTNQKEEIDGDCSLDTTQ